VLVSLARHDQLSADQQQRCRDIAGARFAAAALCPEVEPTLDDQWAEFLLHDCWPHLTTASEQRTLLTHARDVLGRGLTRTRFTGLRSRLEAQLGRCLVLLAQYAEAINHFQAAANAAEAAAPDARAHQLWGVALLRHGQATRDKMMVRQAIDRLLRALELQPDYPAAQFSLAAAYAQLRQFDQATRHLQQCLRHDPRGLFHARAETDPDLRALRQTEAVRRLLHLPAAPEPATRTTISEK